MAYSRGYSYKASWGHAVQNWFTEVLGNLLCLWGFFRALINLTSFLLSLEKFQS